MINVQNLQAEIYQQLCQEVRSTNPDINKVIYLTGLVEGHRDNGFEVPEIEEVYLFIRQKTGSHMLDVIGRRY